MISSLVCRDENYLIYVLHPFQNFSSFLASLSSPFIFSFDYELVSSFMQNTFFSETDGLHIICFVHSYDRDFTHPPSGRILP